jgi:hypothetical protein
MASKFGGLLGGGSGKSENDKPDTGEAAKTVARPGAAALATARAGTRLPRVGVTPAFAILLDATGSMAPSIAEARDQIGEILTRVRAQLQRPIQVQFLCYRDYDVVDGGAQGGALLETSPMTEEAGALSAWLARIQAYGGGMNSGEAIEAALEAAFRLTANQPAPNQATRLAAVLLAGDEPSNSRSNLNAAGRHQAPTAHDWARQFGGKQVPVHTFVVGDRPDTIQDFGEIARLTGGKTGRLDGSASMLNMAALAMVAAVGGTDAVRSYVGQHRLTGPEKEFATLLLTGPKS